ncbi:MAG: hypothetical protein J6A05_09620 [Oscillospiraceae bacterium]|nr:hypothetical protein [Oscillospiraceae bacterium]
MKRFFAILLSAILLTACSEKVEVAVEEITVTEVVTEEVTTVAIEETSASVTETTVEETAAETTVETTAETEESTTAETAAQTKDGTYAADKDSILGTWYAIDSEGVGEVCWTFSEDGTFTASDGSEQETGTYTIDNGLMELTYTDEDEPFIQSHKTVVDEGVLIFAMEGLNTELIREKFVPYEAGQSVYDYFDDDDWLSYPVFMSREKAVLAEQKDVLGKWIATECDEVVGTMLCEENSITMIDGDYEETMPVILKNGVMTAVGEIPENVSYSDVPMYLCGGKLYMFEDEFPIIIERISVAEKASFPTGNWLNCVLKFDYADEKIYTFNDDGTYRISMQMHDIYGKYAFLDNVLTMTFDLSEQGWGTYKFSFDVEKINHKKLNNIYILKYKSEEIDGNMPDVQTVTETSDHELIVELENLFEDYRNEEMLCFEKY